MLWPSGSTVPLDCFVAEEDTSIAIWLPLRLAESTFVEDLLRRSEVLVAGYEGNDSYVVVDYLVASTRNGLQFRALFDRNLISPLVALARGESVPTSNQAASATKLAAACACFCILAEINIEPNIGIYEYASTTGNDAAQADARLFRLADNSDARAFLDIAMGRANCLPPDQLQHLRENTSLLQEEPREKNFERTLRMWRANYLFVLKTMALRRSGLKPFDAALALVAWQAGEAFFNAPASTYCLAAIAHSPPKGGMLKGIFSSNPETLRAGARNAAWDICLLQQFGRFSRSQEGTCWGLWSTDRALRQTARHLFVRGSDRGDAALVAFHERHWGVRDGRRLLATYQGRAASVDVGSDLRVAKVVDAIDQIDHWIADLERELGL